MCAIRSKDEALIVMDKLKKRWKDSCEGKDEAYNMLTNLHVKNLALIDEIEVEFGPGLNILTGETGAGKSIIIGSVNLALGRKMSKEMIREGEHSALVELVFQTRNPKEC